MVSIIVKGTEAVIPNKYKPTKAFVTERDGFVVFTFEIN
jgi:hypothetical protein